MTTYGSYWGYAYAFSITGVLYILSSELLLCSIWKKETDVVMDFLIKSAIEVEEELEPALLKLMKKALLQNCHSGSCLVCW